MGSAFNYKMWRSFGWFLETTCFFFCASFDIYGNLTNQSDLQQPNQQFPPPPRQRFCRSLAFGQHARRVHARAVSYLPQGESMNRFSEVETTGRCWVRWERLIDAIWGRGVEKFSRWEEFLGVFFLGSYLPKGLQAHRWDMDMERAQRTESGWGFVVGFPMVFRSFLGVIDPLFWDFLALEIVQSDEEYELIL